MAETATLARERGRNQTFEVPNTVQRSVLGRMAITEKRIRQWVAETSLPIVDSKLPAANWSFGFKLPNGLQLSVVQPTGRPDVIVVGAGLNLDPQSRSRLSRRAAEFGFALKRDLLLAGIGFQFQPPEEVLPENIQLTSEIYEDGLSKDRFFHSVFVVGNAAVLTILRAQEFGQK
jgi:hypothetical protein